MYTHGKELPEIIFDQLGSLSRRLEFLCRAYDKIAYYSQRTVNHDIQHNQLYHLTYFAMLSTGVFDNLAHIIKEFYKLEITARTKITLRFPIGIKFYKELKITNTGLYDFLSLDRVQRQIEAFYPIRDSLQHRELFQVVQFSDTSHSIHNKSMIKLIEEPTASDCIYSHRSFMDPLLFIIWAQGVLINIVDTVLSLIDWNSISESLSLDIQNKIRESNAKYEQGGGHLLQLPEEPWYF